MTKPLAIVGGGPCGLVLARLLDTAGINYLVFERDTSPEITRRNQGGTLDLHGPTGQEALRRAGLIDKFDKLARRDATTMIIQDSQGNNQLRFGAGRDAPEIDRSQLRQMLLDSIPGDRIRWGKALRSVGRDENKKSTGTAADWNLRFEDGSLESGFRMIVGADGAWSKVRSLITPAKPQYSGIAFIEGRISHNNPQYQAAHEMVGAGNSAAMSANATLTVQQMSDQSYRVYMGVRAPEAFARPGGDADGINMEKARAAMLGPGGFFSHWAPGLRAFVEAAEGPWRPWPLYRLDPDLFLPQAETEMDQTVENRWTRAPGVTLLGDAAHVTTPNGEGVNEAMYNALRLFDCIVHETKAAGDGGEDDHERLEQAIGAYEEEMRARAHGFVQRGINMEEVMYADDGVQRMVNAFAEK
ncbi:hypothetical protein FE257_011413 [Aspergillus nanangensis]|uniref:FAD-binding domain-containing protein n=1 Tax=Aspergillus nanangensis TaxID=2582783 RepID=A0AAD4CHA3_ASPNN|nr:hypothetical protein FE257_011413 [Aspergillus nanangensis]